MDTLVNLLCLRGHNWTSPEYLTNCSPWKLCRMQKEIKKTKSCRFMISQKDSMNWNYLSRSQSSLDRNPFLRKKHRPDGRNSLKIRESRRKKEAEWFGMKMWMIGYQDGVLTVLRRMKIRTRQWWSIRRMLILMKILFWENHLRKSLLRRSKKWTRLEIKWSKRDTIPRYFWRT